MDFVISSDKGLYSTLRLARFRALKVLLVFLIFINDQNCRTCTVYIETLLIKCQLWWEFLHVWGMCSLLIPWQVRIYLFDLIKKSQHALQFRPFLSPRLHSAWCAECNPARLSAQFLPLKNAPLLLLLYLAAIVLQNAHDPKILPFKKLLSSATIYFSLQEMKQSHVFNSMRVQLHILD